MAATSPSIPQLFTELERLRKEGSYSKAQKIANKILQEDPKDSDAFHCKVVCLIQQSCFREAFEVINSGSKKGIKELPFEKAYCLYRLNKTDEALQILNDVPDQGQREKELTAQVYYRLGEYDKCRVIYKDLIKNSQDDYEDERETNLSAVAAASSQWGKTKLTESGLREDTYELCYNAACLSLANNDYKTAKNKLMQAEVLCRKSLDEDPETTEEDVDAELGVLRTQLGFTHQMQGTNDEAMKLYNQVLKSKPTDIALAAVASNNVITLNKERDLFDSKKKIKATMVEGLQNKLTEQQHQCLQFNQCLLLLYSNQLDACRSLIAALEGKYPDCDFPCLMRASLLHREKQYDKAIKMLKVTIEQYDKAIKMLKVTIEQYDKAIKTLKVTIEQHDKAIKMLKVTIEQYDKAIKMLKVTIEQHDKAIKMLKVTIEQYDKAIKMLKVTIEQYDKAIKMLKVTIEQHDKAIKMLKVTIEQHDKAIKMLKVTIEQYDKAIKMLKVTIEQYDKAIKMLKVTIEQYDKAIKMLKVTIEQYDKAIKMLKVTIEQYDKAIKMLKVTIEQHDKAIKMLKVTIEQYDKAIKMLKVTIEQYDKAIKMLKVTIEQYDKAIKMLKVTIEQYDKAIKMLKVTIEQYDKAIKMLKVTIEQHDKAIKMLKEYARSHPKTSTNVKLTLVQMCLVQGNLESACSTLSSIEELCHRPGIVSALVTLHTHLGNIDTAIAVLDSGVTFAQENKGALTQSEIISLMRENVAYKLTHGRAKEAVQMLERLHREDPHNMKTLAQLITAYSQVNPKEAEHACSPPILKCAPEANYYQAPQYLINTGSPYSSVHEYTPIKPIVLNTVNRYSEKLPQLEQDTDVDVDSLEVSPGMRFGRQKRTGDDMGQDSSDVIVKKKRRKKKKGKLPKNYNNEVDPDPERWLPKRERSYYKGKRQKKIAVGKGTQGTAVTGVE
ncbi:hypothetical protein QZH41_016760, partial [Actinostola sp. cb2023]